MRWPASSTARSRSATPTTPSTIRCARATARNTRRSFQAAGIWGNVRYIYAAGGLQALHPDALPDPVQRTGTTCWACARSWATCRASAAMWLRPTTASTPAASSELRGFDVRGATPYGYVPTRVNFQLTNPDGSCVPRDPTNPARQPVHPGAAAGLRRRLDRRRHQPDHQCRVPHSRSSDRSRSRSSTTSASMSATNHGQLKQSPEGFASLTAPLYGCPVYNNGSCQGGIPGSQVGFQQDIRPVCRHQLCSAHVPGRRACRSSCRSSTRPSASTTPTTRCASMRRPIATT